MKYVGWALLAYGLYEAYQNYTNNQTASGQTGGISGAFYETGGTVDWPTVLALGAGVWITFKHGKNPLKAL